MTSSPPSSGFTPAVPVESPASPVGNYGQGLRSLRDLTQHLTTRADDSHAAPVHRPVKDPDSHRASGACQTWVRFCALRRIKPHAPPLVRAPVNSFEFQPCDRTPQAGTYCVSSGTEMFPIPTPSTHRLRRGLPGYLIPFAPHAVAPQRQCPSRRPPSPPTFFLISTHFTAPPGIPPPPPALKSHSLARPSPVKPRAFTHHLCHRLRALYAQ